MCHKMLVAHKTQVVLGAVFGISAALLALPLGRMARAALEPYRDRLTAARQALLEDTHAQVRLSAGQPPPT